MAGSILPTFRLLDALVENREKQPQVLARGLGVVLTRSDKETNEISVVFEGGRSDIDPLISHVTLRLTRTRGDQENMIALDIDDHSACITLKDVVARYGQFSDMIIPTPLQPASAPIVYSYRHDWGDLKFLISRQEPSCVNAIHVEYL